MIKFIEVINTITNKKIKREDGNPLFSHVQLLNIFMYYLNYIMNFSKAKVRDLAKAKYEDTYLLTTNKLYHVF